jgi:hypothetical protein
MPYNEDGNYTIVVLEEDNNRFFTPLLGSEKSVFW